MTDKRLTPTQIQIPRWSALEFERLVLAGTPKVAVFDCDGTLWSGDSGVGFMNWSIEQGLVSRSTIDWLDTRYRAYMAGKVSEREICGEMVQIYAGLREQELREAAARFVHEFVPQRIFAQMAALVATLAQSGAEIWAVSSTNKWVVAEGARQFGIPADRILAAETSVVDGLLTSEILDVPTDEGKAASLARAGLAHPDAAFGNSIHDLQMLEAARLAFPVNPSPGLMEAAAKNGWGYFLPHEIESLETVVAGEPKK
jgi:phosphoserine phosphatase